MRGKKQHAELMERLGLILTELEHMCDSLRALATMLAAPDDIAEDEPTLNP